MEEFWASVPTPAPLTMLEIVVSIHVHPSVRAVFLKGWIDRGKEV